MLLVVAATERELRGVGEATADTLVCGIGPVEAAAATAAALASRRPGALLHVGIAGARGIAPGTIVLGSEAVYEDIAGDLAATMPRIERGVPDAGLLEAARRALPDALVRPIGTTARVGGGRACDVEGMEGFAVLRAAALAGVPALEVRAVSNDPGESDRTRWEWDAAFDALGAAVPVLVRALG